MLLGIDVGGTKVALALEDEAGALRARRRMATRPSGDAEADLARIADVATELLEAEGVEPDEIERVGVSVPGPVDLEAGVVVNPPNLPGWSRAPVREVLATRLGRPVAIENDANAGALAEWHYGAGRGTRHLVYLTMSTGVGGGLVLGGRLHRGVACSAGEIGHIPIEWEGEPCACGLRGCLEAYVGGAAWARRLACVTPATSRVAELAADREHPRPEDVVNAAREGDAFARAELARWNDYLARALVTLTFVLSPEIFVLGTIARAAGESLCLQPLRARVREHLWPFLGRELRVEAAALGDDLPHRAGLAVAHAG